MTIIAVNEQKKALEDVIKVIEAALPGEKVHGFQRPKEALEFLQQSSQEKIRFQCFGNFEVFCGENKLVFRRSKAKELLAYLKNNNYIKVGRALIGAICPNYQGWAIIYGLPDLSYVNVTFGLYGFSGLHYCGYKNGSWYYS